MSAELALVPLDRLESQSSEWSLLALELEITNQPDLERAARLLKDIKALLEEIDRSTKPVIDAAHKAHKAALDQAKQLKAPLLEADTMIRRKVGAYAAEEERQAREKAALEAAVAREQREKAEREAQELAKMGEHELAETLRETAQVEAAPPPPPAPPKAAGLSLPEQWHFEVKDFKALVDAVAAGKVPLAALLPNEKVIGQQARSLRAELAWPGVHVYSTRGVSVR